MKADKLISGSAMRVLNLSAQVLVALLLMPFVVSSLGDRMYGFWSLVGVFIGYYGLLDLGLSTAVSRHMARGIGAGDEDECNRIFNTSLLLFVMLGGIALLVTLVIAVLIPLMVSNPEDAELFMKVLLILGINVAISFPVKAFEGLLVSKIRFDTLSSIQLFSLFLRTALIVLVLVSGYKVLAMALVTFIAGMPGKVAIIYFARKNLPFLDIRLRYFEGRSAKSLFSYSIFAFIDRIADILKFRLDFIVISAFLGLAMVTHYRVASIIITYFFTFIHSMMGVLQPFYSQLEGANDHARIKKTLFFSTRISICVSSFAGFGLIFWGKPFIERWMGAEYLDAYPCLLILAVSGLSSLFQSPSVQLLFGISRHRFLALINIAEGICNLLLSLILVRYLGIIGVAIGTAVPMMLARLLVQPVYVCKVLSVKYTEYFGMVLKTFGAVSLSLALPLVVGSGFSSPRYPALFVTGFVSLCLYAFTIWYLGFQQAERLAIRRLVGGIRTATIAKS